MSRGQRSRVSDGRRLSPAGVVSDRVGRRSLRGERSSCGGTTGGRVGLGRVERLVLEQGPGEALELVAVLAQEARDLVVGWPRPSA